MRTTKGEMFYKRSLVAPVVKWAGGKRQLLPEIMKHVPKRYSTYYEPFLGGGAVLFYLQPSKAVVSDINEELINLYLVIRNCVEKLIGSLVKHQNKEDYYYSIRNLDRNKRQFEQLSNVERASRTLFLNKTCYNGLFRVNRKDEFNVPFGKYKNPNIINEVTLRAVNEYFNTADVIFLCGDFENTTKGIEKNSFVYFDPPYDPLTGSANFTGYTRGGFGRKEQIRLKKMCDRLNSRGVKFLLSNSATDFILHLYKNYKIKIVQAKRAINSRADQRGNVNEVLIKNY